MQNVRPGFMQSKLQWADDLQHFIYNDMKHSHKFTDFKLYSSSDLSKPFHVHKMVLAGQSSKIRHLLEQGDDCLVFCDIDYATMELMVESMYSGEVTLTKKKLKKFNQALTVFQKHGLLRLLRPAVFRQNDDEESLDSFVLEDEDLLLETDDDDANDDPVIEGKAGPRSIKIKRQKLVGDPTVDVTESLASVIALEEEKIALEDQELETARKSLRSKKEDTEIEDSGEDTPLSTRNTRRKAKEVKKAKEEEEKAEDPDTTPKRSRRKKEPEPSKEDPVETRVTRKRAAPAAATSSSASPEKKLKRIEANQPNFKLASEQTMNDKLQKGQLEFVRWLMKLGFLSKEAPSCPKCNGGFRVVLVKFTDAEEDSGLSANEIKVLKLDGVSWQCSGCNHNMGIRNNSIFSSRGGHDDSLCWIMKLVLCWSDNTSLMACQQATGADVDKIFLWYDICREYFVS